MASAEIRQSVPIFVSSTYEDLILYREEVQRVLIRLEQIVKGMEYFGSNPKKPLDVCIENVRNSRIFVGIIGMRYGSVEEDSKKSYTRLEYEEAVKNKLPILIYIMDENYPIPPKFVDKDEKAIALSEFKNLLTKNHTVSYFTSPDDLGKKLSSDLLDVLKSIEQIKINYDNNVSIKNDFYEIFKKFLFRPAKYKFQEGELTIRISDEYRGGPNIKVSIQSNLKLDIGDTVCLSVYVIDENTLEDISKKMYLYGDKEMGDWLEQAKPGVIAKVRVRLDFVITRDIKRCDNISTLVEDSWPSLVLLNVISERNNKE